MEVQPIDPRTDPRWELGPAHDYRVIFWHKGSANENDIFGADDVHQVIEWADAEARARGSTYTLYAKFENGDIRGLVWLAGIDPTVNSMPNFSRQHP